MLVQRRLQLSQRLLLRIVLRDPAAHPHHVCQRPVGHALPVGEAAAAVPVHDLAQPVEVLVELPGQPRLADPRDPRHRDQLRPTLVGTDVEQVLDLPQLAVTADKRRLQPLRAQLTTHPGDHPQRPPQRRLSFLALQLMRARVFVDDRPLRRPPRRLTHEHPSRLRHRLHPRGGVHEITCHHPLADRRQIHGCLAGEDTGPRPQLRRADLVPQRRDRRDEIERRAHGPLSVVLGRGRRPPHGHHRVSDELLHRAAVQLDQPPARIEVARKKVSHLLRVTGLRQRREPDQIREQHRDEPPLRHRLLHGGGRRRRRPRLAERRPTLAAKARVRRIWRAAGRARLEERGSAAVAELRALGVVAPALSAADHGSKPRPESSRGQERELPACRMKEANEPDRSSDHRSAEAQRSSASAPEKFADS